MGISGSLLSTRAIVVGSPFRHRGKLVGCHGRRYGWLRSAERYSLLGWHFMSQAWHSPSACARVVVSFGERQTPKSRPASAKVRSEEHTSELQSLRHLVCRLLLAQPIGPEEQTCGLQALRPPAYSLHTDIDN